MARYHGKGGRLFLGISASGQAQLAGMVSEYSIDASTDKVEVSAFGDTNKVNVQGLPDSKISFSGFDDDANDTIMQAAESGEAVRGYLYPNYTASTAKYWYGTFYVDYSYDTGIKDAAKIKGNLVAAGALTRKFS